MLEAELRARELLDALILDGYGSSINDRPAFIRRYTEKYRQLLKQQEVST